MESFLIRQTVLNRPHSVTTKDRIVFFFPFVSCNSPQEMQYTHSFQSVKWSQFSMMRGTSCNPLLLSKHALCNIGSKRKGGVLKRQNRAQVFAVEKPQFRLFRLLELDGILVDAEKVAINSPTPLRFSSLFLLILNLTAMPIIKTMKAEKVSTEALAAKAMDVCKEMLSIICDRTNKDGEDDSLGCMDGVSSSAQHD